MDTFEYINTLDRAKELFKPYTSYEDMPTKQVQLGQLPVPKHRKDRRNRRGVEIHYR